MMKDIHKSYMDITWCGEERKTTIKKNPSELNIIIVYIPMYMTVTTTDTSHQEKYCTLRTTNTYTPTLIYANGRMEENQ